MAVREITPQERSCVLCGATFLAVYSKTDLCSKRCANKRRRDELRTVTDRPCATCGKSIAASEYGAKLYCSRSCKEKAKRKTLLGQVRKVEKLCRGWREVEAALPI